MGIGRSIIGRAPSRSTAARGYNLNKYGQREQDGKALNSIRLSSHLLEAKIRASYSIQSTARSDRHFPPRINVTIFEICLICSIKAIYAQGYSGYREEGQWAM